MRHYCGTGYLALRPAHTFTTVAVQARCTQVDTTEGITLFTSAPCYPPSAICLLNANDMKVQNATWSADGHLVANPVAQQGLAYG